MDAKNVGLCTGEGTYTDPYVIQNLEIDSSGTGSSIWVENSNVYFKIENCIVSHSGSSYIDGGIELNNVINGRLIDNLATSNLIGIFLDTSDNNSIVGNTLDGLGVSGAMGIKLLHSKNNTIYFNSILRSGSSRQCH